MCAPSCSPFLLAAIAALPACGLPGPVADAGVSCPDASTALVSGNLGQLQVGADRLYFLDYDARAVKAIDLDGGTLAVVHAASGTHDLNDFRLEGDVVYVIESEKLPSGAEGSAIWAAPVAGGAPRLVVNHDDPRNGASFDRLDRIVASDDAALYVIRAITGAVVFRVDKASGAETVVSVGPFAGRPQRVGADLYFTSNDFPIAGKSGTYGIGRVSTAAIEAAPVRHGTAGCDGELIAGAFGFLCTGAAEAMDPASRVISSYDPAGKGHRAVWQYTESKSHLPRVGTTDGTVAYVASDRSSTGNTAIVEVALADGTEKAVACGRRSIRRYGAHEGGGIHHALAGGYDMALTATDLFWVETQDAVTSVFRAPRPR